MADSKPILPEGTKVKRPIIIPKHGKKSKKKDGYIPHDYPDEREDFDFIFEGKFGKFLVKSNDANTNELPPPDPIFYVEYDENKHFAELSKYLKF